MYDVYIPVFINVTNNFTMSSSPTDRSEITQPSPTTMGASPSQTGAIIGAILAVLAVFIVVTIAVYLWYYFKRRKQTHSFHETFDNSADHAPTFRALSTWEEAINSQQKQADAAEYSSEIPSEQMTYPRPDLIPGTNDVIQNNQYGRLRNDTITSEISNLPTIPEVNERPHSAEFENPGFDIGLDELLDPALLEGRIVLNGESSPEEESDNERKSPTDLDEEATIIESDPADEATIVSHNEEDDHVSTKEKELSDDLIVEIDSPLQTTEMVSDTNAEDTEDIENGFDNPAFEMETDTEVNDTSTESPTASPD